MQKAIVIGLIIFLFAFSLRLWNLNEAGRWTDEEGYGLKGYAIVKMLSEGDFGNEYFYKDGADHPLFAVYFYGLTSLLDYSGVDKNSYNKNFDGPNPTFHYDFIHGRLLSIIISSLSVFLVFLFCIRFLSYFVGVSASIMLAMIPHFLGYSQFVGLESFVMLTFTSAAISYFLYLDTRKKRYVILTGIFMGLCVSVKQSGVLVYFLLPAMLLIKNKYSKEKLLSPKHLLYILLVSGITLFITYPMPFFHIVEFWTANYSLWFADNGKVPEVLFGRLIGTPIFYYILAFFITTPLVIILLSLTGIWRMLLKRNWIYLSILVWLLVPFFMSFFHFRQHMVRYIIQFYAPLSVVAAIGLEYFAKKYINKKYINYLIIAPLVAYLFIILWRTTPYYLSYFNELTGGSKNVYQNRSFMIGWFGEGLKGPGLYLAKNASKGNLVGLALDPGYASLYKVPYLVYEKFDPFRDYDYVVVNNYNVVRSGFDYATLSDYKIVYTETVGGIDFARVYKRK